VRVTASAAADPAWGREGLATYLSWEVFNSQIRSDNFGYGPLTTYGGDTFGRTKPSDNFPFPLKTSSGEGGVAAMFGRRYDRTNPTLAPEHAPALIDTSEGRQHRRSVGVKSEVGG